MKNKNKIKKAVKMYKNGIDVRKISIIFNVTEQTIYNWLKYKNAKMSRKERIEFKSKLLLNQILNSRKKLIDAIPEDSKKFIEKLKKIGDVILISNNDYDLVKTVSEGLSVKFLAENKYIFEFKCVTNKKSKILRDAGIIPEIVITDDAINETDFLDCATKLRIVIPKKEYSVEIPKRYIVASNLNEAYEKIENLVIK